MNMKHCLAFLLFVASTASAFQVSPKSKSGRCCRLVLCNVDEKEHQLSFNAMEGYKSVDLARAKDCADHFGKCSVEEMEQLRNSKSIENACCFLRMRECELTIFPHL
jgi:hypothetical protein